MGLLNSILGGMVGNALGRSGATSGMQGYGRGSAKSRILMALLPVLLSILANRRRGAPGAGGVVPGLRGSGGGLGGLGGLGALAGLGGLGALLQRFQERGYADQAHSWVSTGENQPIAPEAVSQVFDHDELSQIASQAGVSEDEARTGLSELLPSVVDHLTPGGNVPDPDQLASSFDDFARELQQQGE